MLSRLLPVASMEILHAQKDLIELSKELREGLQILMKFATTRQETPNQIQKDQEEKSIAELLAEERLQKANQALNESQSPQEMRIQDLHCVDDDDTDDDDDFDDDFYDCVDIEEDGGEIDLDISKIVDISLREKLVESLEASTVTPISVDDYEVTGTDDQATTNENVDDGNANPFPNVDDAELNIPQ
ncbi:hypothetical protein Tco_0600132 [Tanacetum coccineum]|uniref:Uncharacterized protein n=1 Tax=Tanacetum coccineum TaxID=301880 RepID=A0ABQ4WAX4_9ASTR